MTAVVYDSANPEVKGYGYLMVEVQRNDKKPRFDPPDYATEILETTGIGATVLTVNAEDENGVNM